MKRNHRLSQRLLLAAGLGLAASFVVGLSTASGQLLFSDSFQYTPGQLNGDGPPADAPPGQTAWGIFSGNPMVVKRSLRYPMVYSTGNKAELSGARDDHATAELMPVTGGVVWISYLTELSSGSDNGFAVLNTTSGGSVGPGFGLLFDKGVYGIDNDTGRGDSQAKTDVAPGPTPDWLVIKLDFDAGREYLFVNPSPRGGEPVEAEAEAHLPMTADFKARGFSEIILGAGDNSGIFLFDEVRVGLTFDDVRAGH